jgi:hypothetical protein
MQRCSRQSDRCSGVPENRAQIYVCTVGRDLDLLRLVQEQSQKRAFEQLIVHDVTGSQRQPCDAKRIDEPLVKRSHHV